MLAFRLAPGKRYTRSSLSQQPDGCPDYLLLDRLRQQARQGQRSLVLAHTAHIPKLVAFHEACPAGNADARP